MPHLENASPTFKNDPIWPISEPFGVRGKPDVLLLQTHDEH